MSSEDASGPGGDENALPTIADDLVVTKYKMAAEIVNRELEHQGRTLTKMFSKSI